MSTELSNRIFISGRISVDNLNAQEYGSCKTQPQFIEVKLTSCQLLDYYNFVLCVQDNELPVPGEQLLYFFTAYFGNGVAASVFWCCSLTKNCFV